MADRRSPYQGTAIDPLTGELVGAASGSYADAPSAGLTNPGVYNFAGLGDTSSYLRPGQTKEESDRIDPAALQAYLQSRGLTMMQASAPDGGMYRWVQDADGNVVGDPPTNYKTNDDAAFYAAALGLAGVGAYAALGAGAGVGTLPAQAGAAPSMGTALGATGGAGVTELAALPAGAGAGVGGAAAGSTLPAAFAGGNGTAFSAALDGGLGSGAASAAAGGGGMDWLQLAGQLASTYLQSSQTSRAAGDQRDATAAAMAENARQYDTNRADLAPYREAGGNALRELVAMSGRTPTHEEVMADPGYQFAQQQGQRGIDARFARYGGRNSGGAIKEAARFNQGNATQYYGNAYQRLQDLMNRKATIAGLGQTATGTGVAAGSNSNNVMMGLITGQGDANAAARLAQGSIWGNAANSALAQYSRGRQQAGGGGGLVGGIRYGSEYEDDPYGIKGP